MILIELFHFLNFLSVLGGSPFSEIRVPLILEVFSAKLPGFFVLPQNHSSGRLLNLESFGDIGQRKAVILYVFYQFLSLLRQGSVTLKEILEYLRLVWQSLSGSRILYY